MRFFLTGTDTDVGKTYCAALLTRALRRAGHGTVALKPICCGPRDDVEELSAAADGVLADDIVNPIWLQEPAAPLIAARLENRTIDPAGLDPWFSAFGNDSVLVEGAGGWLVPITGSFSVADLAVRMGLPVIVVIANRLGCLNHSLLTIESVRARGLTCAGYILNHLTVDQSMAARTNRQLLEELAGVPLLLEVWQGQREIDATALAAFTDRAARSGGASGDHAPRH